MKRFNKVLFIFIFVLGACQSNNSTPHETWKLVKLVTVGEGSENIITEIVTVNNCGIPEHKAVECSAGTSNDLSISFGGGVEFGEGLSGSVDTSVTTGLGIVGTGGETLTLDEPAQNKIYRYMIDKIYKVLVGDALAQSSNKDEQMVTYTFHASCNLEIKAREELPCKQVQAQPPPTITSTQPTPTSISAPPTITSTQPTPTLTSASASPTSTLIIYDSFDDPNYNGRLNYVLWRKWSDTSSSVQAIQQNGVLVFSDKANSTGEGLILFLRNWQKPKFVFFEVKLKLDSEDETNGNITINAFSPSIPGGYTEFGIEVTSTDAILNVYVNSKSMVTKRVANNTWYILRIEYDDEKHALGYLLDGEQIALYTLPSKPTEITPGIQLWHPDGSSVTGHIDYVSIGD